MPPKKCTQCDDYLVEHQPPRQPCYVCAHWLNKFAPQKSAPQEIKVSKIPQLIAENRQQKIKILQLEAKLRQLEEEKEDGK